MLSSRVRRCGRRAAAVSAVVLAGAAAAMPARSADPDLVTDQLSTATPIKHVIVVIGENRTFDHIYGTYVPKSHDSILNLLSEGIVTATDLPGPNFAAAKQFTTSGQTSYFIGADN
jgi:phospholipase C